MPMNRLARLSFVTGCFAVVLSLAARPSAARNIDLSTVPDRETVQLTIYNSEDLTLVRETRKVSFKPGVNGLQFSWANTLIDPTSVDLRFLTQAEKLEVLDTTFPHDKPKMLYWNVHSEIDGEATVEITYFTSGISWASDYVLIADDDETEVSLENFVRVTNNSGEEYEDAQVRLVVGKVNLVEKIAQLAQLSGAEVSALSKREVAQLKHRAFGQMFDYSSPAGDMAGSGWKDKNGDPKQIIKEGLSEYFIYTIEGTETIPNGWSKRLRSLDVESVPLKIEYRYRPREYGDQLVRMYLTRNDEESELGTTPLPDGIVRVFRRNGRDGLSFLGSQSIPYVPIGEKIELNLGPRPGGDLRTRAAGLLARQYLAAGTRQDDLPPRRRRRSASRRAQHGGRLERPHALRPTGSQLHRQTDLLGGAPHIRRPRRLPLRA
jgi:hypothetical protein